MSEDNGQAGTTGVNSTTTQAVTDGTAPAAAGAVDAGKGAAAAADTADAGKPGDGAKAAVVGKEGEADGADKGKEGAKDGGKAAEAPADYSKLTMPEGYKTDDPVFADAVKLFGDKNIAPDVAQELIDFTVKRDAEIAKAVNDASAIAWTKQTGEWRQASEKEFSAEDLGDAKTALSQVFDKETIAYLEGLGFTNHPGLLRGMVKVSKAIKDDTFVSGNAARGNGVLDAKSLYPNTQHN